MLSSCLGKPILANCFGLRDLVCAIWFSTSIFAERILAGTGKTILSSMIIQQLFNNRALRNNIDRTAIAYFYFDFTDLAKRSVDNALRRLVLQLSRQSPAPYETLKQQYDWCNGLAVPTYPELLVILQKLLGMFDHTYLFLDALDEAEDHNHVTDFVETICAWSSIQLHALITSQTRRVFEQRFSLLENLSRITIHTDATSGDIRFYISKELESRNEFQGWKLMHAQITESIAKKSAGMFRMAYCLVNELKECAGPGDLQEALAALPNDLHDIYARPLKLVPKKHLGAVQKLLQWLAFSERPLTLAELEDTIAFNFSNPDRYTFDPSKRPIRGFFLNSLWTLVSITHQPQDSEGVLQADGSYHGNITVSLAHSSVQDYLLQTQCTSCLYHVSEEAAHQLMAQTCVCYLLYFADHSLNERTLPNYPLAMYAGKNWSYHLLHCRDQAILSALTMHLLKAGSRQYSALNFLEWQEKDLKSERPMDPPLYLCAGHGYIQGVKVLLEMGADVNTQGRCYNIMSWPSWFNNALQVASAGGHLEIVRLLLEKGADANAGDEKGNMMAGTALQLASGKGHLELVKYLLNKGANVNANGGGGTALQAASAAGHSTIVSLLLREGAAVNAVGQQYGTALLAAVDHPDISYLLIKAGADVNAIGSNALGRRHSALQLASQRGHIELVRLLLEKGASVSTPNLARTALHAASEAGHSNIVHLLLNNGAKVSEKGSNGYTALEAASRCGHLEMVQVLFERGANVNSDDGSSALHWAALEGDIEILRFLLNKGADINSTGRFSYTALEAASSRGHIEIVHLLFKKGANVNKGLSALGGALKGGHLDVFCLLLENGTDLNTENWDGSALACALRQDRLDIVHLLLEKGANVNADGGEGTVLQLALSGGHLKIVPLLLKKGADVNAHHGDRYGTALALASQQGHIDIVHLLLEHGADVNKEGGPGITALQAASQAGQHEITRLLLDKGANINTQSRLGTALTQACKHGHLEVIKILLEEGADVNLKEICRDSALQVASAGGHTEIVKLLLEKGADVNTRNDSGSTALHFASRGGNLGIVKLLLEKGAGVNARDITHRTALHYASEKGNLEVVKLLLQNGSNVDEKSGKGRPWLKTDIEEGTALHFASREGHIEIVELLLEKGADINAKSKNGFTAWNLALSENFFEIADLLLENGATAERGGVGQETRF